MLPDRCDSRVQLDSRDTAPRCCSLRNYSFLGSTPFSSGFSIPDKAYPTRDTLVTFFESYTLRLDGKLSAIHQGSIYESRKQRSEQDKGHGMPATRYQIAQGIHDEGSD